MKYVIIYLSFALGLFMFSCTSDFDEINTNPNAITQDEASARYFLTVPQYVLYGPNRFPYWRAQLIHADRYAGHFTFGNHGCWWTDELGYSYDPAYTDATWDWLSGYLGTLDTYLKFTREGGEFENENMYAVGKIIKSLYFQMYTDIFGEIPYSEAAQEGILLPKYDTQAEIYQGLISDLNEAMATIGDKTSTGDGIQDLGENDLYFGGNLQKWKKLANTLKLRIATRAMGAEGAGFATSAIEEALQNPLLSNESENALLDKDTEIDQFGSAAYGDVWHNFGGLGSKWTVSQTLLKYLIDNDDPRLSQYAQPAPGGSIEILRPNQENDPEGFELFPKRAQFLVDNMRAQGAEVSVEETSGGWMVTIPENQYYLGQPIRMNAQIKPLVRYEFYSQPSNWVIQQKNQGSPIFPEIVMTAAESYFLQAQAAVNGMGGDAQALFQEAIRQAMKLWEVSDGEIDAYLAEAELAQLNGTPEENLEKIAIQRWIAAYTDGFEAWSIVRKTGYPSELANGVSDVELYGLGTINGAYPQRMRYGNGAYNSNGDNVNQAVNRQGADRQDTKLWFAK
ncbi:SusD/RagB family nutrient-binding outer membrane lipoprotein [Membranihabitans maritimus]|uniref:SusD/RagB family nutrient-binding outer membrane lipoprotein n=1 Tax=Membranihabitans maritimus TaxID=2904244 RepID=UPI001F18AB23|nr:SusD/RagB family nutrient-binding outer membrane lipoprotein [Membranihabitans maritimus]